MAGIGGVVLGLVFLTLIGAPEDVWNHYIEPALMLISVLAFGGFMTFSVLLFNVGRKK